MGVYRIPTDAPEADGTLEWDETTLVTVHASGGSHRGFGYTYAHRGAAIVIEDTLRRIVEGRDAFDVEGSWWAMLRACRNAGQRGIAMTAISAVDVALWDLKAKALDASLPSLLGKVRDEIPIYGSGGFTSYGEARLCEQLADWVERGIPRVKMKVGAEPEADGSRVRAARAAIGPGAELFVDANGAYDRAQALRFAAAFAESGVSWFEEPVSSDDVVGLADVRRGAPAGMAVAAGEYGYLPFDFRRWIDAGAVDVLQADATRCGGLTGILKAGSLADTAPLPLSAHTAPSVHAVAGCAIARMCHVEYFHDHVRIESMLFDGALEPERGVLRPDASRPGLGVELKRADAARFAA